MTEAKLMALKDLISQFELGLIDDEEFLAAVEFWLENE